MRRATVIFCLLSVVAGPIAACGDTGDSKLSNGQDLPPGALTDSGNVDGTTNPPSNDDSGSTPDDSGSMMDPDTGSTQKDAGTKQKDSGSVVDSSFDAAGG